MFSHPRLLQKIVRLTPLITGRISHMSILTPMIMSEVKATKDFSVEDMLLKIKSDTFTNDDLKIVHKEIQSAMDDRGLTVNRKSSGDEPLKIDASTDLERSFDKKVQIFGSGVNRHYKFAAAPFELKFVESGDSYPLILTNEDGRYAAHTLLYQRQTFEFGPLKIETSFPEDFDPEGEKISGLDELVPILQKHGIRSRMEIIDFVDWLLQEVCGHQSRLDTEFLYYTLDLLMDDYDDNEDGLCVPV